MLRAVTGNVPPPRRLDERRSPPCDRRGSSPRRDDGGGSYTRGLDVGLDDRSEELAPLDGVLDRGDDGAEYEGDEDAGADRGDDDAGVEEAGADGASDGGLGAGRLLGRRMTVTSTSRGRERLSPVRWVLGAGTVEGGLSRPSVIASSSSHVAPRSVAHGRPVRAHEPGYRCAARSP
jgi:hypothetical protein